MIQPTHEQIIKGKLSKASKMVTAKCMNCGYEGELIARKSPLWFRLLIAPIPLLIFYVFLKEGISVLSLLYSFLLLMIFLLIGVFLEAMMFQTHKYECPSCGFSLHTEDLGIACSSGLRVKIIGKYTMAMQSVRDGFADIRVSLSVLPPILAEQVKAYLSKLKVARPCLQFFYSVN